ncbi:MAG: HTH domain-containing protein [Gemmiger sp.]
MRPNERRRKIIEILNLRRHDTMQNLAQEFGVSRLTIYRDILTLEEEYPLIHIHGRAGGIALPEGYRLSQRYLSPRQAEAIRRNLEVINPEDRKTFQSILDDFAWSG